LGIIYLICLHEAVWIFADLVNGGLRYIEEPTLAIHFGFFSGLHVLGFQVPLLAGKTFLIAFRIKKANVFNCAQKSNFFIGLSMPFVHMMRNF